MYPTSPFGISFLFVCQLLVFVGKISVIFRFWINLYCLSSSKHEQFRKKEKQLKLNLIKRIKLSVKNRNITIKVPTNKENQVKEKYTVV